MPLPGTTWKTRSKRHDALLFPHGAGGLAHDGELPGKGLSKEALVYYEVLDWAYPRANYLDVRLMGILEPWDFAKVGPFDPAMQEGDFRVVSVDASTKDQVVIDKLALDVAGNDAEAVLGLNKKSIRTWARKARKHKDGLVMVPVYFVDRPATDSRDGEQVRIAVNGQTGRAAAVVFSDKRETHIVAPLSPSLHLSGESTVHATPVESNTLNRRSSTRLCAVEAASNRARWQPPSRVLTERKSPNAAVCWVRYLGK